MNIFRLVGKRIIFMISEVVGQGRYVFQAVAERC